MRDYVKLFIGTAFASNPTPPPDFNLSAGPGIYEDRESLDAFLQQGWDFTESFVFYVKLNKAFVIQLLQMGASFSALSQPNPSGNASSLWYDNFKTFLQSGADHPEKEYGNMFIPDSPRSTGINSKTEIP